jgi:hypothetical protein
MADFANGNLCGASSALNSVLSKFSAIKVIVTSALDFPASVAAVVFGAAQNELSLLLDNFFIIEIPALPKLNLQAEISNLISLIPGSDSYISAFAKIKLEFGDVVENLEDLVSLPLDSICSIVPSFELGLDGIVSKAADQVLQPNIPALTEVISLGTGIPAAITDRRKKIEEGLAYMSGLSESVKDLRSGITGDGISMTHDAWERLQLERQSQPFDPTTTAIRTWTADRA